MKNKEIILNEIKKLTDEYFSVKEDREFIHGKTKIPLSIPTYDSEEAKEAIESILTTYVTMGKKVKDFEKKFADYTNTKHAYMVTSGSTANLLALSVLTNPLAPNRINPGEEIITPALTFATTVYPIIQNGAKPVLVDVDIESLNINLGELEKAITKKTKAIMPVHLLGNPCEIEGVMDIARKNNLLVLEDVCDSSGAEINGKKAGSFGDIGTYSFFFTHIMSTMEGGMLVTNNEEYSDLINSLRTFGWIRDARNKEEIAKKYSNIDPRFLFYNIGYNLKPTDVQGAFGIHQIKKLDEFVDARRQNANYWTDKLEKYSDQIQVIREKPGTKSTWYGYPVIVRDNAGFSKKEMTDFLESKGLETRPILAGNIEEQPVMRLFEYEKYGNLKNSKLAHRNGFFIGNHHGIKQKEREAVVDYIDEFMLKNRK